MSEGRILAIGPCYACRRIISFNVDLVPSFEGQPICRECVELANEERLTMGLEPIRIFAESYGDNEPGAA